jgi:hypothetical protein
MHEADFDLCSRWWRTEVSPFFSSGLEADVLKQTLGQSGVCFGWRTPNGGIGDCEEATAAEGTAERYEHMRGFSKRITQGFGGRRDHGLFNKDLFLFNGEDGGSFFQRPTL